MVRCHAECNYFYIGEREKVEHLPSGVCRRGKGSPGVVVCPGEGGWQRVPGRGMVSVSFSA